MDAKDHPLRDSDVQIDLFSVAYLRTRDETAIINAEGFSLGACPDFPLQWIAAYTVTKT